MGCWLQTGACPGPTHCELTWIPHSNRGQSNPCPANPINRICTFSCDPGYDSAIGAVMSSVRCLGGVYSKPTGADAFCTPATCEVHFLFRAAHLSSRSNRSTLTPPGLCSVLLSSLRLMPFLVFSLPFFAKASAFPCGAAALDDSELKPQKLQQVRWQCRRQLVSPQLRRSRRHCRPIAGTLGCPADRATRCHRSDFICDEGYFSAGGANVCGSNGGFEGGVCCKLGSTYDNATASCTAS